MEDKIDILLMSYSLPDILEECGVTEEAVLTILVNRGTISLEQFFEVDDLDDDY